MKESQIAGLIACGALLLPLWMGVNIARAEGAMTTDRAVRGLGSIAFGHEDEGRAVFDLSIRSEGGEISGYLECAAEIHHDDDHSRNGSASTTTFPHIVVKMDSFDSVDIGRRKVTFAGPGTRHDGVALYVTVSAYDGEGAGKADTFHIVVKRLHHDDGVSFDDEGTIELDAKGDVFIGDLSIGRID